VIVAELWRFPVKSMGGERLERCGVTRLGLDGDRRWGLLDARTGRILTAKREGRLLMASARCTPSGAVVTLPDGRETDDSNEISAWLDLDVRLIPAGGQGGTFENPRDFENETDWVTWQGPPLAFHDIERARVSLLSRETIRSWDPRRFRSNLVLDGSGEDHLVGRNVTVGSVTLSVEKQLARCVMVTRAQPGLVRDLHVLRTLNSERGSCLGVGALVETEGSLAVGDKLSVG
jgi:uncharacterized protein YcbX